MPLSWNEIQGRALKFSRDWADTDEAERQGAQTFWNDFFFEVFGVNRRRLATFEFPVKKLDGRDGRIDCLWKGMLLIEHKSRGKDLNRAYEQARDYFHGLTDAELPKYLLVSDFARFRLYDLDGVDAPVEFELQDLHKHIRRFGFIAGYQPRAFKEEDPVNVLAAERMGKLHDALKAAGYDGHALEVLLVRLLFCLFADDTGIFARHAFHELVAQRTSPDGADLGQWLAQLFQTLNTDADKRQKTLDVQLGEFPYVNGKLFAEPLPLAAFNAKMRGLLLDASALDWSRISPAIFGSMFQSVMDAKARRNLGAHYTSEKNILKLIGPLFLDDLKSELERIGTHEGKLKQFHTKLAGLKFLDPACGCGNFLVIAYRELRMVELEVLARLYSRQGSVLTNAADHVVVDVDQFFGIEIEEFPAQIAQVALWLMDHQMNLRVAERFGEYFARLPLKKSPTIEHGNALHMEWNDTVPAADLKYLLGNPPFVGKKKRTKQQAKDHLDACRGIKGAGVLDFVAAWYVKAATYMKGHQVRCAFVATSSITQGEQVGILWGELLARGITIHFAHRTFQWRNEAPHVAAVHCVIIGFDFTPPTKKQLFDYLDVKADPISRTAANINPYLVDAPDILLAKRSKPLHSDTPRIRFGSMANDDGNLLLSPSERDELVGQCPAAANWIRPFMQADELLYSTKRYCLWLVGMSPAQMAAIPGIAERVARVRAYREGSDRPTTVELARTPSLFGEIRQPPTSYLIVPRHTGEDRRIIPIAQVEAGVICGDANLLIADASTYTFGIFESRMHMAWVNGVCGRLESRYRYSAGIVYNNFPWPDSPSDKQRSAIENAAQAVLDARAAHTDSTLADLYDPDRMPPNLAVAHQALDRAVDAAYGKRVFQSDADRVAFLFERYRAATSLLAASKKRTPRRSALAV